MSKSPYPEPCTELYLQLNLKPDAKSSDTVAASPPERSLMSQVLSLQKELDMAKTTIAAMSGDLIASEMLSEHRLERITELETLLSSASISASNTEQQTLPEPSSPTTEKGEAILQRSDAKTEKQDPTLPRHRTSEGKVSDMNAEARSSAQDRMEEQTSMYDHAKELDELRRLVKFYRENSEKTSQMFRELEVAFPHAGECTYPTGLGAEISSFDEASQLQVC